MKEETLAKLQAGLGAGLFATPWWAAMIHDISALAGMIAAICGAIIGVHAVYRIYRGRNGRH